MPLVLRIRYVAFAFALLEMFLAFVSCILLELLNFIVCNHVGQIISNLIFISALNRLVETFLVVLKDAHSLDFYLAIRAVNVFSANLIETLVSDHLKALL